MAGAMPELVVREGVGLTEVDRPCTVNPFIPAFNDSKGLHAECKPRSVKACSSSPG